MAKKTIIVFSGDYDKVMAAFIIANGAVAMGDDVTMFFTFWDSARCAARSARPPASPRRRARCRKVSGPCCRAGPSGWGCRSSTSAAWGSG